MKEEKCVLYTCSRITYAIDNLLAFLLVRTLVASYAFMLP